MHKCLRLGWCLYRECERYICVPKMLAHRLYVGSRYAPPSSKSCVFFSSRALLLFFDEQPWLVLVISKVYGFPEDPFGQYLN